MCCAISAPTLIASPSPTTRLVALSDGNVTFRWRDSAHGNKKRLMTLPVDEFLRRFLLHLLPRGFVRIRNFGFLANRQRATLLPLCFRLLQNPAEISATTASPGGPLSLTLAMSALRRNHACCRTPFRRATPPPIPASLTGAPHESTSPASNHPRASARTELLRLNWPTMPYQPSHQPRPVLSMRTISRCSTTTGSPAKNFQHADAISALEQVLAAQPNNEWAHRMAAICLQHGLQDAWPRAGTTVESQRLAAITSSFSIFIAGTSRSRRRQGKTGLETKDADARFALWYHPQPPLMTGTT